MSDFPSPMGDEAFIGPAGAAVRALAAQVEANQEAVLIQLLLFLGSVVGDGPRFRVSATWHHTNENLIVVGQTSRSRKGTGRDVAMSLLEMVDPEWQGECVKSGATSGEGIVAKVRDETRRKARSKEIGDDNNEVVSDEGVEDKRLLLDEAEFSAVLKVASREGNTLSDRLRAAWDHRDLEILNKNTPMRATNPHISLNGHTTREELRLLLTDLSIANGFGNRFLFCAARRAHKLSRPNIDDHDLFKSAQPLVAVVEWARDEGRLALVWSTEAGMAWDAFYQSLNDDGEGLASALTARQEAHTLRLAMLYAISEQSDVIELRHLRAAQEVWRYSEATVRWVYAGMVGDETADVILATLREAAGDGMTRSQITLMFPHNPTATKRVQRALQLLEDQQLARRELFPTGGKPGERWWAITNTDDPT